MTSTTVPPPSPRWDAQLLTQAQQGDEAALLTLLAQAQPDIRRYARRSCQVGDDVEDAVQETRWLLYRRLGTVRLLGCLSAWLKAVVRHHCLRLARAAWGRQVQTAHDDVHDLADDPRLAQMPTHELRIDVARALQSLPEHYRTVVLLRDVEELTVDEMAATLGLSREAVKGRLHRARGLLREHLLT
jgi:RNA polymerase sigma factor (sigma-70 family)